MKKQILDQKEKEKEKLTNGELFNAWLNGLSIIEYANTVKTLKERLGWSDQVFSQKRKCTNFKLSEQIAIECITAEKIFI